VQIKSISLVAVGVTTFISMAASANIIAGWSIATAIPAATTGTSYNYGVADSGDVATGTMLSSAHALAATTYSSPAGNGSTYSFSANNWTAGDYVQVSVATTGYSDVSISWDQTRSGTGPASFELVMSTDGGTNWSTLIASYAVVQAGLAGSGTTTWNTVTNQAGFTITSIATDAANQGNVLFRMRTLVTTAAAGTNRVDNIVVSGNVAPAPGAIALLGLAGLIGRRRR